MALYSSFLGNVDSQQPQQNQYLTGNPTTQMGANTDWMNQGSGIDMSKNSGFNGGNISQTQSNPPSQVSNGTMLGSIAAGNYTPTVGWDTNKLNDPNKSDPKYNWLRAVQNVGGNKDLQSVVDFYNRTYGGNARVTGKDTVDFGGDVGNVDVLFDQEGARQNLWAPITGGSMPGNSMFGQQQGNNNPFGQNNQMQQIWQALQARRNQFGQQELNPTGGSVPFNGNTGINGGAIGMGTQVQPQFDLQSMLGMQQQPNFNPVRTDQYGRTIS